jgi:thioredoxin reductase (NADPH)
VEAFGEERLEGCELKGPDGERRVPASSLFVFIGAAPGTEWLPASICATRMDLCWRDRICADGKLPEGWNEPREPFLLESSVPGVFVAGDVRHGSIKRVASAVGEGSIAVQFAHQYLAGF